MSNEANIPPRFLAEAAEAISFASEHLPELQRNGFDPEGKHPGALGLEGVATALAYLDCGPVKPLKAAAYSGYGLKHRAENWGRRIGFAPYVANGDFLCAAIWRGVPVKRVGHGPNCLVGLSVSRWLENEPRPAGGAPRIYVDGFVGT